MNMRMLTREEHEVIERQMLEDELIKEHRIVYNKALEEAAKIAEVCLEGEASDEYERGYNHACEDILRGIRALAKGEK